MMCADSAFEVHLRSRFAAGASGLGWATILSLVGAILITAGLAADLLGVHGGGELGWLQLTGLVTGTLIVASAVFIHADLLAICGLALVVASATVDMVGPVGNPGFGWRQILTVSVGVFFVNAAFWLPARCLDRPATTAAPPEVPSPQPW